MNRNLCLEQSTIDIIFIIHQLQLNIFISCKIKIIIEYPKINTYLFTHIMLKINS